MNETNIPMRRRDRKMSDSEALELLKNAPYVFMSTADAEGDPYCVPINIVMTDDETAYIHGMKTGRKIDNITHNPHVCLSYATSKGTIASTKTKEGFIVEFKSVVAFGTASLVDDLDEKKMVLTRMCEQLLDPKLDAYQRINESVERSAGLTTIYKIHISSVSGKKNPNDLMSH